MVDEPAVVTGDNQRTFRLAQRFSNVSAEYQRLLGVKAEGEGFEPPVSFPTTVFKTVTFGRSVSPPGAFLQLLYQLRASAGNFVNQRGLGTVKSPWRCG